MPTAAEVKAADDLIQQNLLCDESMALLRFCLRDSTIMGVCQRSAKMLKADLSVVIGTYVAGLYLGMKISEAQTVTRVH